MTTATGLGLYTTIESPIGELLLLGDGRALRGLYMQQGRKPGSAPCCWEQDPDAFTEVSDQLGEYFAGERTGFELALEPVGSPFQLQVWGALLEIEYGETLTYGELARRIGRPNAPRAVGAANGANPLSVVVPCHRLIGSDGTLTGYGGGIERKRLLLDLEARSR
jgi:methylated-DNA-[protein]-cysteine S-methyltransferase